MELGKCLVRSISSNSHDPSKVNVCYFGKANANRCKDKLIVKLKKFVRLKYGTNEVEGELNDAVVPPEIKLFFDSAGCQSMQLLLNDFPNV